MKKTLTLFIMTIFLISVMPLSIAKEEYTAEQIMQKKESLRGVALNLKDYMQSTKDKIEISESIPESEKAEIIEKLNKKIIKMDEDYNSRIENIESIEDVNTVKTELKNDIKEIKPVVEKPVIKIQKDQISKVILKLKTISKKLGVVIPLLDDSEKDKIKKLKGLIDSASDKLNKAERLLNKDASNSGKIKSLLNEATGEIKQAFELTRELLSQLESNVLNDIEMYEQEKQNKIIKTEKVEEDGSSYCDYTMTWYDEGGSLIRKDDYNPAEDKCGGFRSIHGNEISPSCYNKKECSDLVYKCIEVSELKKNCKATKAEDKGGIIENTYAELNEIFELKEGQSAKLVHKVDDNDNIIKNSIILTVKDIGQKGAAINMNYWSENDDILNKYEVLDEDESVFLGDYNIDVVAIKGNKVKLIITNPVNDANYGEITKTLATDGEIIKGIELISVDIKGNSCMIEYDGSVYTINKGYKKTMSDGVVINVKRVSPSNTGYDYCTFIINKG